MSPADDVVGWCGRRLDGDDSHYPHPYQILTSVSLSFPWCFPWVSWSYSSLSALPRLYQLEAPVGPTRYPFPFFAIPHVTTLLRYYNPTIDVARSTRFPLLPPCLSFLGAHGGPSATAWRRLLYTTLLSTRSRRTRHMCMHTPINPSHTHTTPTSTPKQGGLPACLSTIPSIHTTPRGFSTINGKRLDVSLPPLVTIPPSTSYRVFDCFLFLGDVHTRVCT